VPVNRWRFLQEVYQPDDAVLLSPVASTNEDAQMVADSMGRLPRPARVLDQPTRGAAAGWRAFRGATAVGEGQNVIVAYHAVAASHPDAARFSCWGVMMVAAAAAVSGAAAVWRPGRTMQKALVDTSSPSRPLWIPAAARPRARAESARLEQGPSLDTRARPRSKGAGRCGEEPPTPQEVSGSGASCCEDSRTPVERHRSQPAR